MHNDNRNNDMLNHYVATTTMLGNNRQKLFSVTSENGFAARSFDRHDQTREEIHEILSQNFNSLSHQAPSLLNQHHTTSAAPAGLNSGTFDYRTHSSAGYTVTGQEPRETSNDQNASSSQTPSSLQARAAINSNETKAPDKSTLHKKTPAIYHYTEKPKYYRRESDSHSTGIQKLLAVPSQKGK